MKNTKKITLILLFILSTLIAYGSDSIENSMIPIIEKMETIENLPCNKLSKSQYAEISNALARKKDRIRIVTYNMLRNDFEKGLKNEDRWSERMPRVVCLLKHMQPDIICSQELLRSQIDDLLPHLCDIFALYYPPNKEGELNAIFYRRERFDLIHSIPQTQSKDFLTILQLKDWQTGLSFAVLNTHLAYSKIEERDFQVRFITERLKEVSNEMPVIFTGDLNTFPNRPELDKLPFYDGDYVNRLLTQGSMKDAYGLPLLGNFGPMSTFTNTRDDDPIPFKGTGTPGVILDHIYVSNGITVLAHAVQPAKVNGHFPSDHMPVLIDFILDME